ncbi:MAG: NAD-dependent epimerase/dehydratase family protein [Pseudomonadota bacterium]
MLTHNCATPTKPPRVVIVGGGFVSGAIEAVLNARGITNRVIRRADVDLGDVGAGAALGAIIEESDTLVAAAAIAPCKDLTMLQENLRLIETLATAIQTSKPRHVVNISSDAIYSDSPEPLNELSCTGPGSLHGIMHLTRETVLGEAAGDTPFATLRPTLIYGVDDPHNGYGPNRFRRLANAGEEIALFGEGEERRDHVHVGDVAELAVRMIEHRSAGALNAATGTVISFREAAGKVVELAGATVSVRGTPRSGPMPHNGYRPFDPAATRAAFADFDYLQPADGFALVQQQLTGNTDGRG